MEKLYSSVSDNLKQIRFEIGESIERYGRKKDDVRLMAVTKTVSPEIVNEAIAQGVLLLGENKAQELLSKYEFYEKQDVEIHFIGHLQSNKVKQVIDKVTTIQSLDSLNLAREIDRLAQKNDSKIDALIEVNIGREASKSGVLPQNLEVFLRDAAQFGSIHIKGLMTIPPLCGDTEQTEKYFSDMQELFVDIRGKNIDNVSMDILSMGMSGDYRQAIKHGANIIRIGTALFGARNYLK